MNPHFEYKFTSSRLFHCDSWSPWVCLMEPQGFAEHNLGNTALFIGRTDLSRNDPLMPQISILEDFSGNFQKHPCGLQLVKNGRQHGRQVTRKDAKIFPCFHGIAIIIDEAHFWLNGYVNKQNCRIWSEANPQVYVETPLHPEKLTVWCALWAGGILLQKR
ncbi:uncharacterized protein TNCV_3312261 [Trichonephila clavipes]|nr:uncharacterized protein TNCV_3312261 [Trichonephila clavipes]